MIDKLPPPIGISQVPLEKHPDKLPCRGGCLYVDCIHAAPQQTPPFELVNFTCAPRHEANGYSSWTYAKMCDLEDCPWTKAKGDNNLEEHLLNIATREVAKIEDPSRRASNVTPESWRRATIKTIFEYQDQQPQ